MYLTGYAGTKNSHSQLTGDEKYLKKGQTVALTTQIRKTSIDEIPVDFKELPRSVRKGGRILLDDGNLELKVEAIEKNRVIALVVSGGMLKSHKGISLPDAQLDILALTAKDEIDLEFGMNLGVDAVALSFVRSEKDIILLRKKICEITQGTKSIPIIAKLERPEAIRHLERSWKLQTG